MLSSSRLCLGCVFINDVDDGDGLLMFGFESLSSSSSSSLRPLRDCIIDVDNVDDDDDVDDVDVDDDVDDDCVAVDIDDIVAVVADDADELVD